MGLLILLVIAIVIGFMILGLFWLGIISWKLLHHIKDAFRVIGKCIIWN